MKLNFIHDVRQLLIFSLWVVLPASAVDFNYKIPLAIEVEADGYVFDVPKSVYLNVAYDDLRDIRILNSSNDNVPMRLSLNDDEVKSTVSTATLPVFSLNQTVNIPVNTKQVKTSWEGRVNSHVVTTSNSIQNYVQSQEVSRDDAVIIDATSIQNEQVVALEMKWDFGSHGNRVFYVELLGSNDLSNWQNVLNHQKMIELDTGSKVVLENKMPLPDKSFEYYQLRFKNLPIPEVLEVKAIMLNHAIKQPLNWSEVASFVVLDPKQYGHHIEWDMGGYFPVESIKIDFDYKNLMADVKLFSKSNPTANWQVVAQDSVYAVGDGEMAMFNDQITFRTNRHRYWKLVSNSEITSQWVNQLSFAWRQHQIRFLAQGAGPYGLHFGSAEVNSMPNIRWYNQLSST
ncbi:MAG: DUF3999 family protein, partial [Marinicella sp.]